MAKKKKIGGSTEFCPTKDFNALKNQDKSYKNDSNQDYDIDSPGDLGLALPPSITRRFDPCCYYVPIIKRDELNKMDRIAKDYEEQMKDALESCRHASLNNYDYDRLKKEYASLSAFLGKQIETICPTLKSLIDEAEATSGESYPGRHLPFDSIKGRTAWRYQCLRIMDELLYTSPVPVTDQQMEQHIFDVFDRLGLKRPRNIIEKKQKAGAGECVLGGILKRNYVILDELISVEHNAGERKKYDSSVYESGRKGHLYKQINPKSKTDGERFSAFKVVFSFEEALALKKELGIVRVNYFYDDHEAFAEKHPLLGALHDFDKFSSAQAGIDGTVNKLSYGDMVTVNYQPSDMCGLKKKIEKTISSGMPVAILNGKNWDMFIPIKINKKGRQWALLAKNIATGHPQLISPVVLLNTFKSCDTPEVNVNAEDDYSEHIIGLSPLINSELWDITLELTDKGRDYVMKDTSVFQSLSPSVTNVYHTLYDEYTTGDKVNFSAYLNNDIFEEFLTLDARGQLIDILPEEVMHLYEDYFIDRVGKYRMPLCDRPRSAKVIKLNKRKTQE